MGSGAKTPQGGARLEQAFVDVLDRSRTTSISQATVSSKAPALPSASALSSASVYSERTTREIEVERTFTSTSRVSSSVSHVERDRRSMSSSTAKVATSLSSVEEKRGRESEKVKAKEKERLERELREKEKELEREREQRGREEKERGERERAQREREEQERIVRELKERQEQERQERELKERQEQERQERERQEWERQEWEREQREIEDRERQEREKEEKEKKEREKAKGKGKGKAVKGISKHNSPIDMADSVVGKSPGHLAETLTSTWGSQSKAVTPAASPWPLAKSVGPSTPKMEQSSESHKLTPRNAEVKLSTPATPALGEAEQLLTVLVGAEEPLKRLSIQLPHVLDLAITEAPGQTPADSLPTEQFLSVGATQESVEVTQTFEQTTEYSQETVEQSEATLFGQSATNGMFSSWGTNIANSISSVANATSTAADGWTHLDSQSNQLSAAETTSAKSSPSLGWGIGSSIKSAKNKFTGSSFGAFGGRLSGFLDGNDHNHEEAATSETLNDNAGSIPLESVKLDDITFGGDPFPAPGPVGDQGASAIDANDFAAPSGEALGDPLDEWGPKPVVVPELQTEPAEEPNADTGDKGVEDTGDGGGEDGQGAGDEDAAQDETEQTSGKKKKGKGGANSAPPMQASKSGDGGGKKKKKKK